MQNGVPCPRVSPSPCLRVRDLPAPFLQFPTDERDDLLMLLVAAAGDGHRLAELEPDLFRRVYLAIVLQVFSVAPGVGLEGDGDHRHVRPPGELDADGIELRRMEDLGARGLGEDDDGAARLQADLAAFEHGLEVVAWIRAAHGDGVPGPHDVLEDRVVHEALLHHEGRVLELRDDRGQDHGLQGAHVVADEDAGPVQAPEVVDAVDLDDHADLFERPQRLQAAGDPVRSEELPALRLRAAPDHDGYQAGIEAGGGEQPSRQ